MHYINYYATTMLAYATKHWHCPKSKVNNKWFSQTKLPFDFDHSFGQFPDIPPTTVKFPDISEFFRQVVIMYTANIQWKLTDWHVPFQTQWKRTAENFQSSGLWSPHNCGTTYQLLLCTQHPVLLPLIVQCNWIYNKKGQLSLTNPCDDCETFARFM